MPEQKAPTPQYSHRNIEIEDSDFSKYKRAYEFLNKTGFEPIVTDFATSCYVRPDGTGVCLKTESTLLHPPITKLAIALPKDSKFLEELIAEFPETEKQLRR